MEGAHRKPRGGMMGSMVWRRLSCLMSVLLADPPGLGPLRDVRIRVVRACTPLTQMEDAIAGLSRCLAPGRLPGH